MPDSPPAIPIPSLQRREILRERWLPLAGFALTVFACAYLWRYQAQGARLAIGEVHVHTVVLTSPADGELLPADGQQELPSLLSEIKQSAVVARVHDRDHGDHIIELRSPIAGKITSASGAPGQFVRKGDPIIAITSAQGDYIFCRLDNFSQPPMAGLQVAIRRHGPAGADWLPTTVQAVGPAIESASHKGDPKPAPDRGLPVRISLPTELNLIPGSLVDIRFPPASH
jgi:hypothetical protein